MGGCCIDFQCCSFPLPSNCLLRSYRVSGGPLDFWHPTFFRHMLTQQAVLSRAERAYLRIWFFEKKIWKLFFFGQARGEVKSSLVFRLCLVLSMVKVSAGNQLFGLKTTSPGKSDPKNSFLKSDLRHGGVQGEVWVWGHRFTKWSGFQAKKLNTHGEYELDHA